MKRILFLLFMIWSLAALADQMWWELYESALNDIKSKKWSLAEEKLKAAMAQQPNQGKKVRAYGARFMKYIPEYYLAVVHYNTGKYQEALEEFLRVKNKGLISQGDDEYAELSQLTQQSMAKLGGETPAPVPTAPTGPTPEQQFAELMGQADQAYARKNYQEAKQLANQALSNPASDQKPRDLLRKIEIAEVAEGLSQAMRNGDETESQKLARRLENLDPQNPELARWQQATNQKLVEQKSNQQFQEFMQKGEKFLASKKYAEARVYANQASSVPGADAMKVVALLKKIDSAENAERAVSASGKPPENKALAEFEQLMQNAEQELLLKNFDRAKQYANQGLALGGDEKKAKDLLMRAELEESVLAFYSGEYEQAVETLDRMISLKQSARAHFYLGCSVAALAFLQEKHRDPLLEKAKTQFAQARKLKPDLRFDPRFISPRILQIYEETR